MKRYSLDVITGASYGGNCGIVRYKIDADGFDYYNGCYTFKVRDDDYPQSNMQSTVASFPINRTIIKRIDEL